MYNRKKLDNFIDIPGDTEIKVKTQGNMFHILEHQCLFHCELIFM